MAIFSCYNICDLKVQLSAFLSRILICQSKILTDYKWGDE